MIKPASRFFGFNLLNKNYQVHYLDWGNSGLPVVICAHGLTRNARDFDFLAQSICTQHRLIAVDFPGRGLSDWLHAKQDYIIPTYLKVTEALFDELDINTFDWLGTSMGGLIGMILASQYPEKLKRLIINDVGPEIPDIAINRINDYLSIPRKFGSNAELEHHLREIYAPFGQLTDGQWKHLTRHSQIINAEGELVCNYDPDIAIPFRQAMKNKADLWNIWQSIAIPVYLIHGENSDILPPSIVEKMKRLQPDLKSKSVKNTGHAPALMDGEQIQIIENWLSD